MIDSFLHKRSTTTARWLFLGPVIDDANERAGAQFVQGDSRRQNLLLGDGSARHAAQKKVQQPLAGRRVVKGAKKRSIPT